jgi:hypothetical protein
MATPTLLTNANGDLSSKGENMVKYIEKIVLKDSKKMVKFLTQVEESRLKIIENNKHV